MNASVPVSDIVSSRLLDHSPRRNIVERVQESAAIVAKLLMTADEDEDAAGTGVYWLY